MVGDSPLYVRRVDERHKIVRQTDSGLGVDAQAGLGSPLSPEALLNSSLPHDLVMGGMARAGSRQSTLVITFPPRSKHLLISRLQSPSAVILEPKTIKSATVSTCFSSYLP